MPLPPPFDRELRLNELLPIADQKKVEAALTRILARPVVLTKTDSPPLPGFTRQTIIWDFEPLAYVAIEGGDEGELQGAVEFILLLLKSSARFQMVTDLHMETVHSDYEALQEKHNALKESEQRYKNLTEQLEIKVAQQVKTIQDAQVKLYQAEKMASVGQLAAGVAHEINTPLAYIQNNFDSALSYLEDLQTVTDLIRSGVDIQTLKESWQSADLDTVMNDFPQLLQDSLSGVKKVASIVADLKVFSNINKSEQMFDNINTRLKTVIHMITPQLREGVAITFHPGDIPELFCSPGHIGQVFYNLILNGAQSIRGAGEVIVRSTMQEAEICVSILDTGEGIEQSKLAKIFEPFFTTKEVGQGTGLGLTVTNDIIKAHGGRIEVESQPGQGSRFSVYLPTRTED